MSDTVELTLVCLAVTLGLAAFAIGAQLIRSAWRDARADPYPVAAVPSRPDKPTTALRSIAAFEALKALVVLAAAWGFLAFAAHPDWLRASFAIFSHLGLVAREQQASGALTHWLAAERQPMLLGALGYAGLHLAEAWGLWHLRPWGEAMGVASGSICLPFEVGHLLHRPAWTSFALLALNLAVVSYLAWRLRMRTRSLRMVGGPAHPSA